MDALDAGRPARPGSSGRRPRLLYTIPTLPQPGRRDVCPVAAPPAACSSWRGREDLAASSRTTCTASSPRGARRLHRCARWDPAAPVVPAGLLLQVAGAGAPDLGWIDALAPPLPRTAVGRRRARERRLRELSSSAAPGGGTAGGRAPRRPRGPCCALACAFAPRRAGGSRSASTAGRAVEFALTAGVVFFLLGHPATGSDGLRPAAGGRAPRRRVRPRTPVPHRWRRPRSAALLQPLRRGQPRRGRAAARGRRRRGHARRRPGPDADRPPGSPAPGRRRRGT